MKVLLKFPECNMQVISNNAGFLEFVRSNYYLFLADKLEKIDLTSKINFGADKFKELPIRISSKATLSKDALVYNDSPLSIQIKDKPLIFEANFKPTLIKHVARALLRGTTRRRNDYYEYLIQKMVRYPLFFYWERKGFQLHHSASIEKNGKVFLFLGLDKMGKSTTSLKMSLKGYKIMSDNFTLIKDGKVYPYLRGVRATDFVRKNLPELRFKNLKIDGNKYQIVLDNKNFCFKPTKIKKLFFMRRGTGFKCEKIDSQQAAEQLLSISNASLEYPHHHYTSLIPFVTRDKIAISRYKKYLELAQIPAYNLEYSNFKDVEEIEKELE